MARSRGKSKTMAGSEVTGRESNKELLMILVSDVRENRTEINTMKNHLMSGAGKIAGNREAITNLKKDVDACEKDIRHKSYIGSGGISVGVNILAEVVRRMFGGL